MKEIDNEDNIIINKSQIELKDYDFDIVSQESESNYESLDDNIAESIPESNNNEIKEEKSAENKKNKIYLQNILIIFLLFFYMLILLYIFLI